MTIKTRSILILDDEKERRKGFTRTCAAKSTWRLQFAETAATFLDVYQEPWDLISLDHDLALDDPLDGLDVVNRMTEKPPTPKPPVIVHSSNSDRAAMMMGNLELEGWQADRVAPFGDDWLESHWLKVAERRLATS